MSDHPVVFTCVTCVRINDDDDDDDDDGLGQVSQMPSKETSEYC